MKTILSTLLLLSILISSNCQIIEAKDVPFPVKVAFEGGYPSIKEVQWRLNGNYYNATYEVDQLKKIVTYNEYGIFIESKAGVLLTELPKSIQEYVNLHGTGDFLKEYYKVIQADGTESYEIFLNDKNITFNSKGELIKSSVLKA